MRGFAEENDSLIYYSSESTESESSEEVDYDWSVAVRKHVRHRKRGDEIPNTVRSEAVRMEQYVWVVLVLLFEILALVAFGLWFDYPQESSSPRLPLSSLLFALVLALWTFLGLGLLGSWIQGCFRTHVLCVLISAAIALQASPFFRHLFLGHSLRRRHELEFEDVIGALWCCAALLIAQGAYLGKGTPLRHSLAAFFGCVLYWLVDYLVRDVLSAYDSAHGVRVHIFGSCYGLALTWLASPSRGHFLSLRIRSWDAGLLVLGVGCFVLCLTWPILHALAAPNELAAFRALFNTLLALAAAAACAMAASAFSHRSARLGLTYSDLLLATLAGGVVVSTAGVLDWPPALPIGLGCVAGYLAILGLDWTVPVLRKYFVLQDTMGIIAIFFMPAVLGALVAALIVVFTPARSERPEKGRQWLMQLLAIVCATGVGLLGGAAVGVLNRLIDMIGLESEMGYLYSDQGMFVMRGVHQTDENLFVKK